jgi:hypothetical protein
MIKKIKYVQGLGWRFLKKCKCGNLYWGHLYLDKGCWACKFGDLSFLKNSKASE